MRKKKLLHASVYVDPSEIVRHLVGLKDVRVLSYARRGPAGEITIEQIDPLLFLPAMRRAGLGEGPPGRLLCGPALRGRADHAALEEAPARLSRRRVPCALFTLGDHRISAVGCRLTTRAAKWEVKQVGGGQTVLHLAKEFACSWDAINAAVRIYGAAFWLQTRSA